MFSIVGVTLIVFGVIALIYVDITCTSGKNNAAKGLIQVQADQQGHIPRSTIAGAAESCSLKETLIVTMS